MCQYSGRDGFAGDWHLVHYGAFATGGAGIVFTEATAVVPEGRISPRDLGIWDDGHVEMHSRIAEFVVEQGAVPGIQLAHAGRKAGARRPWESGSATVPEDEDGWPSEVRAPTAVPFSDADSVPRALDTDGIRTVVRSFRDAAGRALDAGFRILEVHAAHGCGTLRKGPRASIATTEAMRMSQRPESVAARKERRSTSTRSMLSIRLSQCVYS